VLIDGCWDAEKCACCLFFVQELFQSETVLALSERRRRRKPLPAVTSSANLAQYEDDTAFPFDVRPARRFPKEMKTLGLMPYEALETLTSTNAQKRVVQELKAYLRKPHPHVEVTSALFVS
jgi:hypothetical protein